MAIPTIDEAADYFVNTFLRTGAPKDLELAKIAADASVSANKRALGLTINDEFCWKVR